MVTDLIPASSPATRSINSILNRCFSAQREYILSNISAQSWLSVPPAPAWFSRKHSLLSASPEKRHSTSNFLIYFERVSNSASASSSNSIFFSSSAKLINSTRSLNFCCKSWYWVIASARWFFSWRMAWAFCWSCHKSGAALSSSNSCNLTNALS